MTQQARGHASGPHLPPSPDISHAASRPIAPPQAQRTNISAAAILSPAMWRAWPCLCPVLSWSRHPAIQRHPTQDMSRVRRLPASYYFHPRLLHIIEAAMSHSHPGLQIFLYCMPTLTEQTSRRTQSAPCGNLPADRWLKQLLRIVCPYMQPNYPFLLLSALVGSKRPPISSIHPWICQAAVAKSGQSLVRASQG